MPFGPFGDVDVAASQSNAQLVVLGAANDVTIDGTEVAATTQTVTTGVEGYPTWMISGGAPAFAAGQQVGVEITTSADWNGTSADLVAYLIVVFDQWDFH